MFLLRKIFTKSSKCVGMIRNECGGSLTGESYPLLALHPVNLIKILHITDMIAKHYVHVIVFLIPSLEYHYMNIAVNVKLSSVIL